MPKVTTEPGPEATDPSPAASGETPDAGGRDARPPEEPAALPPWVSVLIGVVLVTFGGLAVFTGLRYRDDKTVLENVPPRRVRAASPAPQGEPGAGASLVLPENTPAANAPVRGTASTEISGGPGGVQSMERFWARRGVVFNVLPEDTVVHVNDVPIGQVRQFNSMDEVYDFAAPGSYSVKLVAPSGAERTFVVTAADDAKQDIVRITWKF